MGDRADRQAVGESVKIRELHSYSSNVEDWDGLLLIQMSQISGPQPRSLVLVPKALCPACFPAVPASAAPGWLNTPARGNQKYVEQGELENVKEIYYHYDSLIITMFDILFIMHFVNLTIPVALHIFWT